MASLNRVTIIGNVGKEPEMRFTPNGNAVVSFSVAANESYTDNEGERHERTEWFNVVAWEKLAETCNQYLGKGSKVYIEGRQQTKKWEGQDGNFHYKTELIASRVLFLSPKTEALEPSEEQLAEELEPEGILF